MLCDWSAQKLAALWGFFWNHQEIEENDDFRSLVLDWRRLLLALFLQSSNSYTLQPAIFNVLNGPEECCMPQHGDVDFNGRSDIVHLFLLLFPQ